MNTRFRRLAVVTSALTYVLVLLGLYTGATAGGLSCDAQWPLCNGAVLGLFPANWASFFEWSHRLVAMVVGFLMLGTMYGAWRWQGDRRIRWAVTGAIALLPLQVILGAVTTTAGGFFPDGFNPVVIVTHFVTAATIFTLLVVATLSAYGVPGKEPRRLLYGGMGGLVLLNAVFGVTGFFPFYPRYQVVYYGASYAVLAGFLGLATWSLLADRGALDARLGYLGVGGSVAVIADMVLSRQLLGLDPVLSYVATSLVALVLVAAVWVETQGTDLDGAAVTPE